MHKFRGREVQHDDLEPRRDDDPELTLLKPGARTLTSMLPHRAMMEAAFDADFSDVEVRTGERAEMASIGAEAAAEGNRITFAEPSPEPWLVAHELAHVMQHRNAGGVPVTVQRKATIAAVNSAPEREADRVADRVARGLRAGPISERPVAQIHRKADFKQGKALAAMTLSDFDTYARDQADWSTGPAVGADKDKLWALLQLARAEDAFLAGCGLMKVSDLLATGLDPVALDKLRSYAGAVHKDRQTVEIEPIADVHKAMAMGEALPKLEATPGGVTIKTIMKQTAEKPQLTDMIAAKAVDTFISYVTTVQPVLQANTGAEIKSYLAMNAEPFDPLSMKPRLPQVRNLHRFQQAALEKLAINETDTSKTKPFTLILHSALDEDGGFHRDTNLTKMVLNPRNLTLMIEGKEKLSDVTTELDTLAKTYGQKDKIDQVMFAGHGGPRFMQLAGKVTEGKTDLEVTREDVDLDDDRAGAGGAGAGGASSDLDPHKKETDTARLFAELMKHMDPASPSHRVIFNACLTNANEVGEPLSPDPKTARAQITEAIAAHGSLATTLLRLAKGLDSRGANASISGVSLVDETGKLDLVSEADPYVTAGKLAYVEHGVEPEGVMRAVVEEWAKDDKACLATMKKRHAIEPPLDWAERLIHAMFGIVLAHPTDAALMNAFANGAAAITKAQAPDSCKVSKIANAIPALWIDTIYKALAATAAWEVLPYMPLVFLQNWLIHDPTKGPIFLKHLGANFKCNEASDFIDMTAIAAQVPALLPLPPGATPPIGQLTLALFDVAKNKGAAHPSSIAWLQALLGKERRFAKALDLAGRLGGLATESEILDGIGRGEASASLAAAPPNNLASGHTGTNDLYVEPMTLTSKVLAVSAAVREKPDPAAKELTSLAMSSPVRIMGKTGAWFAIDNAGKTGFIAVSDVAP